MTSPTDRLYGAPGAESLHTTLTAALDRLWAGHVDAWRHSGGVGKPEPMTMTIEEWTVHPPEWHLPTVDHLLDFMLEMASDNETDEVWADQATDAINTPVVEAAAEVLRLAIAQGIRYRMSDKHIATITITRSTRWTDGHSGSWTTEDTAPEVIRHDQARPVRAV